MTTTKKPMNEETTTQPVEGPKPTQTNATPNVSSLGGGYGGTQHEQYPGEHGYEDSGDTGILDHDDNTKFDDKHHEPNRDGFRNRKANGELDRDDTDEQ